MLAGGEWQEGDFVFTNSLGGPVDPKQDYEAWQALLASFGIRPTRLHNAQHSAGTLMGGLGVHLRDIQETFGHSTSKVTERYVHVQSEGLRRAAALMDAALAKEAPETVVSNATETTIETSHGLITLGTGAGLEIPSQNEGRLGDLNPGPTHYETAPTHGSAPRTCCPSTSFVTPSDTQAH